MSLPVPQPPAYPLAREEFRRALANGLGRARIHVQRCGAAEFRAEILEAATRCQVFDPQVNGMRGPWLAELCLAAGLAETVVAQPLPHDGRDREQRAALLPELARRGVPGARAALYACFGRAPHSSDLFAASEIIELDGEAGLLFVVRAMGRLLASGDELGVWGYELSLFDERHEPGSGRALVEREAAADEHVRLYLERVRQSEARRTERRQAKGEGSGAARGSAHADAPRSAAVDVAATLASLESLRAGDPARLHEAAANAIELLEEHPEIPGAAIALEVHLCNPCAHCRGRALEELLRLGACPRWVLEECAHDATPWIRELARAQLTA